MRRLRDDGLCDTVHCDKCVQGAVARNWFEVLRHAEEPPRWCANPQTQVPGELRGTE